tara:strand:- start:271 stop:447 length:177 start_codon:yes stop_codon:yes gene_type:complete
MSSLHHEEILEDCYEQSYESFKKSNKLTEEMMQELILHSGVQFAIEKNARKLFEDRCI